MALKDLLAALPPEFKLKVGDKEIDAAAFRNEIDTEFNTATSNRAELEGRLKQIQDERDAAIAAAGLRTTERTEEKPTDPREIAKAALQSLFENQNDYDFNDPYSKQMLKRIENMVKEATAGVGTSSKSELEELKQGILGIAAMTLEGRMNSDFSRHKWPDGYDASRAWSEAIKNGYVNPTTKLPDISRFNKDVMAPLELKGAAEKARQEGIEEGKRIAMEEQRARQTGRGRLGLVPRPGGAAIGAGKTGAANSPRNLGEAIDAIQITDADIAANTGLRVG